MVKKENEGYKILLEELRVFKSLIVPLFLVSMGRIQDRVESFKLKEMASKHSELFLKCWEHNLNLGRVLVEEFCRIAIENRATRYGIRLVFSYAIKQGKRLIQKCRNEYDYNLQAMIRDARNGRINVAPSPIHFIHRLLRPKTHEDYVAFMDVNSTVHSTVTFKKKTFRIKFIVG